jgi:hypothetical protein
MKALSTSAVKSLILVAAGDRASGGSCFLPDAAHVMTGHQLPERAA